MQDRKWKKFYPIDFQVKLGIFFPFTSFYCANANRNQRVRGLHGLFDKLSFFINPPDIFEKEITSNSKYYPQRPRIH